MFASSFQRTGTGNEWTVFSASNPHMVLREWNSCAINISSNQPTRLTN